MRCGPFFRNLLGQFQWYRKRHHGHWELWTLPGNYGTAWLKTQACFYTRGHGPDPRLEGAPKQCEHSWDPRCGFVTLSDVFELPHDMMCPVCRSPIDQHEISGLSTKDPFDKRNVHRICTGQHVRIRDTM